MEESGRRESFAPTYGVHINPVSKGKQIPLCSSGQGCTHEGGPFQRPPIDCTDLNWKISIFHSSSTSQLQSGTKWQNPPKIREINWSYLCLQQFDKFWIWSACNDRKRKLCESIETFLKNLWNHFRRNYFLWVPFWNFVQHSDNYYIEASIVKIYGFCPKQILHMCIAVLCYVPDKAIF